MPNGKPGDHPLTDIVVHRMSVYSDEVDDLVRQIHRLGGADELGTLLLAYWRPTDEELARLGAILLAMRDRRRREAAERGWETE